MLRLTPALQLGDPGLEGRELDVVAIFQRRVETGSEKGWDLPRSESSKATEAWSAPNALDPTLP